jgi:hypothetical protein
LPRIAVDGYGKYHRYGLVRGGCHKNIPKYGGIGIATYTAMPRVHVQGISIITLPPKPFTRPAA